MVHWAYYNIVQLATSRILKLSLLVLFLFLFITSIPPLVSAANDECPNTGSKQGCNNGKICGKKDGQNHRTCQECFRNAQCGGSGKVCKNYKCQDDTGGTTTNPDGTTSTTTGHDEGTSDSSDPDPAKTNPDVDCEIDGVADAGVQTEIGICLPKEPAGFAAAFYRVGVGLIGGLSLIFLIIGAYIMMTSEGNPIRLQNGKTYVFYAIFGLMLAIFGYVFIEVIAVDILRIPGFEH